MTARPFDLKAALSGEPVAINGIPYKFSNRFQSCCGRNCLELEPCDPNVHIEDTLNALLDCDGVAPYREREWKVTMAPRKVKRTVWVSIAVSPIHRPDCPPAISAHAYWNQDAAGEGAVPVEIEVAE